MIFNIAMTLEGATGQMMPFNYHYPFSSAIHNAISKSDRTFSAFFHDVGYHKERFKLFTFSDITVPFNCKGDRMVLLGRDAKVKVCFHVPEAAEHFIKGLFVGERLLIADNTSGVAFHIREVENRFPDLPASPEDIISTVVQPISPLVVAGPAVNKTAPSQYYSPYEKPFVDRLISSWVKKYKAISGAEDAEIETLRHQIMVKPFFYTHPAVERRVMIRDGRESAQKVRGYFKFRMRLTAPKKMIELALNSGLGVKNSVGMGCIELISYEGIIRHTLADGQNR